MRMARRVGLPQRPRPSPVPSARHDHQPPPRSTGPITRGIAFASARCGVVSDLSLSREKHPARMLPRQKPRLGRPGAVRCILRSGRTVQETTRSAAWHPRSWCHRPRPPTQSSPLCRADFGPALTVPAVVLAVLPARLEIAAPAPPQRPLIELGVDRPTSAACATLARASSGPGSQPGRDDRSRSRHHRVGAAEGWLTIAHLDHQSEN